ncbi:hypothetical protein L596_016518 [Steinernema carpocapsae]|uniref:Uncharacterized protein n=1 Tax=Steinernema carpocapsae TaxID=34508 RepID=A0A4U5NJ91_STECR|nr:hypothetical protein L596_016518 [Steinernema carpocapsae]
MFFVHFQSKNVTALIAHKSVLLNIAVVSQPLAEKHARSALWRSTQIVESHKLVYLYQTVLQSAFVALPQCNERADLHSVTILWAPPEQPNFGCLGEPSARQNHNKSGRARSSSASSGEWQLFKSCIAGVKRTCPSFSCSSIGRRAQHQHESHF